MIRRGFWLVTGAALGVAGYRKVAKMTRAVTGGPTAPPTYRVRNAVAFMRDVRDGMADYHELHAGQIGRRLGDQHDRTESGARQQGPSQP
jgi:hypothetical protein